MQYVRTRIVRFLGVPLVSVSFLMSLLLAAGVWETKPYTEWTRQEAVKVYMDSPWVTQQTFSAPQFSGSSTPPAEGPRVEARSGDFQASRQYWVRFLSARPLRMALARLAVLDGRVDGAQAEQYVGTAPLQGDIVIQVSAAPGQDRTEFARHTTESLKNDTYLLLKKSKTRIYLHRYVSPGEIGGTEALFVFKRADAAGQEQVRLEEEEVRFMSNLGSLNRPFKLKNMVFAGKLEI